MNPLFAPGLVALTVALALTAGALPTVAQPTDLDLATLRSALIPKREVGADVFLKARPALDIEKKRFTARRDTLARIERPRADVHRATAAWSPAWQALADARRWEPAPGDKATRTLEALMFEQAGHLGLSLQALEAQLKDEPADLKLQQQRAVLYRRLSWTAFADAEDRRLALQARQRAMVDHW